MNPRDQQHIARRKQTLKRELKAQHSLPKSQRDEREIASLTHRLAVLTSWEKPRRAVPQQHPEIVTKTEFRENFKQMFGIKEAEQIIEIENIEQLHKVWPVIAGKNVMIKGTAEVKTEVKRLIAEFRDKQRINGFR